MLRAFKSQLLELANHKEDSISKRISQCLAKADCKKEAEQVRNFILVIPEMIQQIRAWTEEDKLQASIKRLHGYTLTYLYHPHDFLPEEPYGLFGYLDDAYLVGKVYAYTLLQSEPSKLRFISDQTNFSKVIGSWLDLTRKILPNETQQIDDLFHKLTLGDESSFKKVMAGNQN